MGTFLIKDFQAIVECYHADVGRGDIEMRRGGDMQRANLGRGTLSSLCIVLLVRQSWWWDTSLHCHCTIFIVCPLLYCTSSIVLLPRQSWWWDTSLHCLPSMYCTSMYCTSSIVLLVHQSWWWNTPLHCLPPAYGELYIVHRLLPAYEVVHLLHQSWLGDTLCIVHRLCHFVLKCMM